MAPEILTGSTVPVPPARARTAAVSRRAPARRRRPVRVLPDGLRPPRAIVRDAGTWTLQTVLQRHGLGPVAGVDEAGRGASAGPLVVAACVLRPADAAALDGLTDSKLLTASAREHWYGRIRKRALDLAVVVIPPAEVDRRGVHIANIEGMRRAVAALTTVPPGYVLTDGFAVRGFGRPALAVPKGDRVAACIAAASVLAKVTRDRIMTELDAEHGAYGFAVHKGYNTPEHEGALRAHGPCPEHRFSFANVAAVAGREVPGGLVHNETDPDEVLGDTGEVEPARWEPMETVTGGAGR
ncbi:Ribonuclease HII [Pseudonocardia sp. Ae263_Ps1]|nr:Ribonuclease HII [Pseudonocardia sp. Ae263_Ps1]OLL90730.1 Ribonuclease HII [Pseudonocardia sp. Ae356_Ps1]